MSSIGHSYSGSVDMSESSALPPPANSANAANSPQLVVTQQLAATAAAAAAAAAANSGGGQHQKQQQHGVRRNRSFELQVKPRQHVQYFNVHASVIFAQSSRSSDRGCSFAQKDASLAVDCQKPL